MNKQPYKFGPREIRASDKRIAFALAVLQSHNRGLNALADFKRLAEGMARGLDSEGMNALALLFQEWSWGRRDFTQQISPVVLPPKA